MWAKERKGSFMRILEHQKNLHKSIYPNGFTSHFNIKRVSFRKKRYAIIMKYQHVSYFNPYLFD